MVQFSTVGILCENKHMGSSVDKLPRRRRGTTDKSALPRAIRRRKKTIAPAFLPRLLLGCVSSIVLIFVVSVAIVFGVYTSLTAELIPRLESIKNRTSFETSRLYDRNGKVLYEFFGTGRRTKVTLPNISKYLISWIRHQRLTPLIRYVLQLAQYQSSRRPDW